MTEEKIKKIKYLIQLSTIGNCGGIMCYDCPFGYKLGKTPSCVVSKDYYKYIATRDKSKSKYKRSDDFDDFVKEVSNILLKKEDQIDVFEVKLMLNS